MAGNDVNLEGIIIRLTVFKESDAMANAIGPTGLFSFFARGIGKLTSKNAGGVQSLSHSKFTLAIGSQGSYSLKEAVAFESFVVSDNLTALSVLSFIQEITAKIVQTDEAIDAYPWLLTSLRAIKAGGEPLTIGLIYFAHLLQNGGIGLDVDECVVCHKKTGIIAISYEDGGYVCRDCYDPETMQTASTKKLRIIRYLFRCGLQDVARVRFEKNECLPLYEEFARYLSDLTGTTLKSLDIVKKL